MYFILSFITVILLVLSYLSYKLACLVVTSFNLLFNKLGIDTDIWGVDKDV